MPDGRYGFETVRLHDKKKRRNLIFEVKFLDFPLIWAEVDRKAIAHNVRELRRVTHPSARLMAVVKANAYGHGMIEVAKTALQNGACFLGVARLGEGIQLRNAGIDAPILILGHTQSVFAEKLLEFDLTQTVFSLRTAEALSRVAASHGKKIKIHLKVDSGMGRLGISSNGFGTPARGGDFKNDAIHEANAIGCLGGLELEGVFTHFATADSLDKSYAVKQFERFMDFLNRLRLTGLEIPIKHAANSAAIIDMPETHLDMVRGGISLYGLYPSDEVNKNRVELKPAMELKSRVIHLKKVPAGFKISYGMTYETPKSTTVATVPVGYADGYNRRLSSRGQMLVGGQRAPVVGRICMDLTMLDVGHIPDVRLEDEVVIFGKQGNLTITVDEIAAILETINYEVVSTVTDRVPRFYL